MSTKVANQNRKRVRIQDPAPRSGVSGTGVGAAVPVSSGPPPTDSTAVARGTSAATPVDQRLLGWNSSDPQSQVNLEAQLRTMFSDCQQSPILLCIGQKGGGKSFRVMTMLMWLLHNNVFDQYFLVLPTYFYEAANSYAWLKPFADKVFIAREYSAEFSDAILKRPDESMAPHLIPRSFLWLDDVGMNEDFRSDRSFVGLLSVARHKRLSVCLCYHSLTSGHTLSPFLRQNVTHTLLFRVTNEKLLENVYEELVSMTGLFPRFREFKHVYNQHTVSAVDPTTGEVTKNFNALAINNSLGCLDWTVKDWFPEESSLLEDFLERMKQEKEEFHLPSSNKYQNLNELEPKMLENVKGAGPKVLASTSSSTSNPQRMELTADSWGKFVQSLQQPLELIQKPKGIVQYEKQPMTCDPTPTGTPGKKTRKSTHHTNRAVGSFLNGLGKSH